MLWKERHYLADGFIVASFALSRPTLHLRRLRRTWAPPCSNASGAALRTRLEALKLAKSLGPARNGHGSARPREGAVPAGLLREHGVDFADSWPVELHVWKSLRLANGEDFFASGHALYHMTDRMGTVFSDALVWRSEHFGLDIMFWQISNCAI